MTVPDGYDPLPDLALLLDAALRAGRAGAVHAEMIAERIGPEAYAGPEAAERALRRAIGLPGACEAVTAKRGTICGDPAGHRSGTCECGHPRNGMLCEYHLTGGEPLWCLVCYRLDGTESHRCPVAFTPAAEAAP
jgi:hypothetical protein